MFVQRVIGFENVVAEVADKLWGIARWVGEWIQEMIEVAQMILQWEK